MPDPSNDRKQARINYRVRVTPPPKSDDSLTISYTLNVFRIRLDPDGIEIKDLTEKVRAAETFKAWSPKRAITKAHRRGVEIVQEDRAERGLPPIPDDRIIFRQ